ncbi:thioredoxin family protein [bacterium]|nr:thioredoxin family protein [bacterium]
MNLWKLILIIFFTLTLSFYCNASGVEWLDSLEKAQKIAVKEKKDILIDFTGSDWCGWCIRLDNEVFSKEEWKKSALKKLVLVKLDFPSKLVQTEEKKKYNRSLSKKYFVQGYPTIILMDATGQVYGKTGYKKGGPEAYLKHIDELQARKVIIQELKNKIEKSNSEEAIKNIEVLMGKVEEWRLTPWFTELMDKAIELDINNKHGLRLKYASMFSQIYKATDSERAKKYMKIVKELDPKGAQRIELEEKSVGILKEAFQKNKLDEGLKKFIELLKKYKDPESVQLVKFFACNIHYKKGDLDLTIKKMEEAKKVSPDSVLAKKIDELLIRIKKKK